jgi:hypothetical protein
MVRGRRVVSLGARSVKAPSSVSTTSTAAPAAATAAASSEVHERHPFQLAVAHVAARWTVRVWTLRLPRPRLRLV